VFKKIIFGKELAMSINLSAGIPDWFADQFSDTLYHVCQQKVSKFRQAFRVVPIVNAEDKALDMLGKLELSLKSGSSPETPETDASTQRRWVDTNPYHQSILYDKDDDLSMLIDPTSDFNTSFASAAARKIDDICLAAFDATVYMGRRKGSSQTWAAAGGSTKYTATSGGRTIAHDCSEGNCNASDTGLTTEKIELVLEYFANNDVDENIPKWFAISPRQATQLFGQEEYVNRDYGDGQPLSTGYIKRGWMGFNWIVSNKITKQTNGDLDGDADVYENWAWVQDGMVLGVASELSTRMSIESTRSYAQRIYAHLNLGAMRLDEDKVIKIECQ